MNKLINKRITIKEKISVKSKLVTLSLSALLGATLAVTSTSSLAASSDSLYSQQFFSMKICGSLNGKLDATQSVGLNAKLDGVGTLGLDFYGNGLKAKITPTVGIDTKASSSAFSKITMVSCIDLFKLVEFLEKEGVTSEAEQALVNSMAVFDPDELRKSLVDVAFLTGMEPDRMLRLLDRIPTVAEEVSEAATSANPLELLRSISALSNISEDLPLPPAVRERLGDMEGQLAKNLQSSFNILNELQDVCSASVEPDLQAVIDEICKPLDEIGDAEALRDAILLIPQLLDTAVDVQVVVDGSQNTLNEIRDFLINTVNVSINGIKDVADDTNNFMKNVLNATVNGINSAVNAIKNVVDDTNNFMKNVLNATVNGINSAVNAIKNVVDDIEDIVDSIGGGIF